MRNYEIENEMYKRAVELIETRYPTGWGGAGVVHTSKGNYYTSVSIETANASAVVCIVLNGISLEEIKTKSVVEMLKALGADGKALIVMPAVDEKVIKSARNIPGVKTTLVNTLNVYDILNCDKFIVVTDAVAKIEEVYC